MNSKVNCFVAYPSYPPSLAETIEQAIEEINEGGVVDICGWKSTSIAGRFIMKAICETIDDKDIFICDLTNLNHNVLFELGYAIAKKKRIWTLLDPSIEKSKVFYEKFKLLTTVGFSPYKNSYEIVTAFYKEKPFNDLENTIYKEAIESVISRNENPILLYLKSGVETQASVKLSRRIQKSRIPPIVDDPSEVRIQTLSWYAQNVYNAYAVIAHFLSSDHTEWLYHNAKNSFVSGLAYGFGKQLLILAHEPFNSPIDYREILKFHKTAADCVNIAGSWLETVEKEFDERDLSSRKYEDEIRSYSELQNIFIGDPIAEHESEALLNYFIQTAAYNEALTSKHVIFVGRKGSGKTAILYKLADELRSDLRNHICIIKPIAYQLEGILDMLRQALPKSEKGFLIESFWKYLIYTELAKSVFDMLKNKPSYYQFEVEEEELLKYVENNSAIITSDFSIRLESAVSTLQDFSELSSAGQQRTRISELLHEKIIVSLRSILGKVLCKNNKVAILVDNLDKAWNQRDDLETLSDLLFGLLGVSRRISQDFEKSSHWRQPINLSLILFLRSDIFNQIMKYARERDKIDYSKITWEDPDLLLRVLEERFLASSSITLSPNEVWSRYFCSYIKMIPIREYLTKCILPRPRDLIYLIKNSLAHAINRRHSKIEENDIIEGQKKYSQFALDSLLVENSIQVETLELLLYEFAGSRELINRKDIVQKIKISNISEDKLDDIIELLCDLTFIGREVEDNRFEFLYNDEDKMKIQVMARKTAENRIDKIERYRINEAFHSYLEIKPIDT